MRIRELVLIALVASCVHGTEDPRAPTPQQMVRSGLGGWIVIHRASLPDSGGELIAIDATDVYLYDARVHAFWSVKKKEVASAALYMYTHSGGAPWVLATALSTAAHGFFLVLTLPVLSLVNWSIIYGADAGSRLEYPGDTWEQLGVWARFPQGLPPHATLQTLEPRFLGPPSLAPH
ncbi:MAG TPA: hypothetical protein VGC41_15320 [Kofleriaceae bacterium]